MQDLTPSATPQANTKDCPKCKVVIEKSWGCNHMKCTQCGADFCWVTPKPESRISKYGLGCARASLLGVTRIPVNHPRDGPTGFSYGRDW